MVRGINPCKCVNLVKSRKIRKKIIVVCTLVTRAISIIKLELVGKRSTF